MKTSDVTYRNSARFWSLNRSMSLSHGPPPRPRIAIAMVKWRLVMGSDETCSPPLYHNTKDKIKVMRERERERERGDEQTKKVR